MTALRAEVSVDKRCTRSNAALRAGYVGNWRGEKVGGLHYSKTGFIIFLDAGTARLRERSWMFFTRVQLNNDDGSFPCASLPQPACSSAGHFERGTSGLCDF